MVLETAVRAQPVRTAKCSLGLCGSVLVRLCGSGLLRLCGSGLVRLVELGSHLRILLLTLLALKVSSHHVVTVMSLVGLMSDLAQDNLLETRQLLAKRLKNDLSVLSSSNFRSNLITHSAITICDRGTYADLTSMDLLGVVLVTAIVLHLLLLRSPLLTLAFRTIPVRLRRAVNLDLLGDAAVVVDGFGLWVGLVRFRFGVCDTAMRSARNSVASYTLDGCASVLLRRDVLRARGAMRHVGAVDCSTQVLMRGRALYGGHGW